MSDERPRPTEVVVVDIEMRFVSMVVFMIKWALASIPAFIILVLVLWLMSLLVSLFFAGLLAAAFTAGFAKTSPANSTPPPRATAPAVSPSTSSFSEREFQEAVKRLLPKTPVPTVTVPRTIPAPTPDPGRVGERYQMNDSTSIWSAPPSAGPSNRRVAQFSPPFFMTVIQETEENGKVWLKVDCRAEGMVPFTGWITLENLNATKHVRR